MTILAAGVSHRTAPVEARERLALSGDDLRAALQHFHRAFGNGVILSTCNRTEVYVHSSDGQAWVPSELLLSLATHLGLNPQSDLPRFYELEDRAAAQHLFRVASGVDSMILGEAEILGQVRHAMSVADEAGTLDAALTHLFHEALRTGKQARHETNIGRFAVSVSSAAVSLARDHLADFASSRALVVGAGEAGKLAARALRDQGIGQITVTSRTVQRAENLAEYLHAGLAPFTDLAGALVHADLVITCSSAESFIIPTLLVAQTLQCRETPITFLDLAVPRDVEPAARGLPGVYLYDIDDLQAVSDKNLQRRESAARDVEIIVSSSATQFTDWLESRQITPTIRAIVARADRVRRAEVERTARDLALDEAAQEKLDRMAAAITKKILHAPITYLRQAEDADDTAELVRRIFGVEDA